MPRQFGGALERFVGSMVYGFWVIIGTGVFLFFLPEIMEALVTVAGFLLGVTVFFLGLAAGRAGG